MDAPLTPKLTSDLLRAYSDAALENAGELLAEASLLLEHGHMARAYFLAVLCIEEAGKALQAFEAQNRNLSNPAVCTKIKAGLGNHAQKINYALNMWAMNGADPRADIKVALDLIIDLKRGREPAMYSDLRADPDRVQVPREVVRPEAAADCVRLAEHSLTYARRHVIEKTPTKFTSDHDRIFTMKSGKFQELMNTEDFWWYWLSRRETGHSDFAEAVVRYQREHIETGKPFRTTSS